MGADDCNIARPTAMLLRVSSNFRTQTFPLCNNTTLGNDRDSDIFVNHRDRWHAIVREEDGALIIRTCGNYAIEGPEGPTQSMELKGGIHFRVGETRFECSEARSEETPAAQVLPLSAEPIRHACPRCRSDLTSLDHQAIFCPHCGAALPAECPAWPVLPREEEPAPPRSRWSAWMPNWLRSRIDPLFFGRRTTVLAYINTMFNLGLRFEAGVDGARNPAEAGRYYRKAARLGNIPARVRLKLKRF